MGKILAAIILLSSFAVKAQKQELTTFVCKQKTFGNIIASNSKFILNIIQETELLIYENVDSKIIPEVGVVLKYKENASSLTENITLTIKELFDVKTERKNEFNWGKSVFIETVKSYNIKANLQINHGISTINDGFDLEMECYEKNIREK